MTPQQEEGGVNKQLPVEIRVTSGPTPPSIVANADNPAAALGAFIAQELEAWGFDVQGDDTATLVVTAADVDIRLECSGFGR